MAYTQGGGYGGAGPPGYQGYGQDYGYGYGAQVEHPQGTTILILGILGIVLCQVMSPVAWVMGNRALAEIDANPGRYSNRGNVQAGRICGIVGSVLLSLSAAFLVLYLVFAVLFVAGSSGG